MARTVWKYTLKGEIEQTITTPYGSRLLSAAAQKDDIVVYALVNPNTANPEEYTQETRTIIIMGTGHKERSDLGDFLGTVSLANGALMFHVFEKWGN